MLPNDQEYVNEIQWERRFFVIDIPPEMWMGGDGSCSGCGWSWLSQWEVNHFPPATITGLSVSLMLYKSTLELMCSEVGTILAPWHGSQACSLSMDRQSDVLMDQ